MPDDGLRQPKGLVVTYEELKHSLQKYITSKEQSLESDNFIARQDVTIHQAVELFNDVLRYYAGFKSAEPITTNVPWPLDEEGNKQTIAE